MRVSNNLSLEKNLEKPLYDQVGSPFFHKKYFVLFYPWLIVLMSSCFIFYKYVVQVYPSVMTNELMTHFHIHATGLGSLAACYFYSYLFVQLAVGPLLDRYSTRLLSTAALVLMSVSVLGFSHSQTLMQAFIFRLLMGVGAAFATVSYLKLTAMWFSDRQFNMVAGLLATAASVGAMIGQTPLAYSVQQVGWQHTLYYCVVLGLVIAALYGLIVKERSGVVDCDSRTHTVSFRDIYYVLKNKKTWLLMLYSGLAWSPMAVFGGLWGDPFLQTAYHLDKTAAASLVTVAFMGLAVGGPCLGWLAARFDIRWNMMFVGVLSSFLSVIYVIYSPWHSTGLLMVCLFLFGMGTGAFMLGFAMGRSWFSVSLLATVIALINTGDALLGAVTEPIVGKLLDVFWGGKIQAGAHVYAVNDYHLAMGVLPCYLLLAMVLLFFLRNNDGSNSKIISVARHD